ncbi:MAG: gliding motility-associated ABC transporter ATP-binding subunit GldA [Crocinitomicaceae bacterium]|nr:gliding motility-associated ABC transporter ATP-binding subunit GldA [Crocinitomicaceae bacterium]
MSIKVENVSKFYGNQAALDDVSFSIGKSQIVGFLGPNGAGKSTMMKILTSFIPASKGNVEVCDLNVETHSNQIKQLVGYLPEHNPLYLDMYVKEYLAFVASIHKVKNKKDRIAEMIELVGLEREQKKKIGALSKGYRQRVGLAQAIIHDPEVLILDEPTTGLDPNQLVEIRNLIVEVGKTKTVMLSTHIMQEVEAICDRVILIDNGRIKADDSISNIQKSSGKGQVVYVEFDTDISDKVLKSIKGVGNTRRLHGNTWLIESKDEQDIRKDISKAAQKEDNVILTMRIEEMSMEEVFKKLTKK